MTELTKPIVLLVDDKAANLIAFEASLKGVGCHVMKAISGRVAVEILRSHTVAVVVLDIEMPGMDGFETAKHIRTLQQHIETPIVFVTAHDADTRRIEMAFELGMSDFIQKPVNAKVLAAKVKTYVSLYERGLKLESQPKPNPAVENERQNFRNLFKQTPEMVCILSGPNHVFEFVNEAHIKALGFNATGQAVREAQPESVEVHGILDRVYQTGETAQLHEIAVTVGDRLRYFNLTYAARRDRLGKVDGVMILGVEVTSEVEMRKSIAESAAQLKAAKEEAERANQLKSAFLANMSHEIRTPLGAMIGFADLLRDPSLSLAERSSYIDILSRNGENLAVIINDILDLSKVEAGHIELEYADVRPREIAEDVVSLFRVKAKEKDISFEYMAEDSTPDKVVSDPTRVRQILMNLVSNAVKFTEHGSVRLRSYGCKTDAGFDAVCFEVVDSGVGIESSQIDNIFEMFVQGDGSMTRRFGGTGLGLALSRSLARSLGGDVVVTSSSPGKGSTFVATIEDHQEKRTSPEVADRMRRKIYDVPAGALQDVRVLVVDDAPDNRHLIWHYLNKQGAVVETADNGLIGYKRALSGSFDIVLMDIQMPEMDGYTATHKLRSAGYSKPIVALTAHAMSEVREKCLYVGCDDHLPKPIDAKELLSTVARFVKKISV